MFSGFSFLKRTEARRLCATGQERAIWKYLLQIGLGLRWLHQNRPFLQGLQGMVQQCIDAQSLWCHHGTGFCTVTSRQVEHVRLWSLRFRPKTLNVFLKTNDDVRLGDLGVASSGLTCSSSYRAMKAIVYSLCLCKTSSPS